MASPDTTIIYHAKCMDGFAAAWVCSKKFPGARLLPAKYNEPVPADLDGQNVVIVDFSYRHDDLLRLQERTASLLVLDHHDTAAAELAGLPFCRFERTRCGATMAWEHFFPDRQRPAFLAYVEDYDLWRFALPFSTEINAAIETVPFELREYDYLATELDAVRETFAEVVRRGNAIIRYRQILVDDIVQRARELEISGYRVLGAECPRPIRNEVAGRLAEGRAFGISYQRRPDGKVSLNLRAREANLSPHLGHLARRFGGGGHHASAGCSVPTQTFDSFVTQATRRSPPRRIADRLLRCFGYARIPPVPFIDDERAQLGSGSAAK